MTVLDEASAWLEKMKDHTDCCGTPIVRKLVAEVDRLRAHLEAIDECASSEGGTWAAEQASKAIAES